MPILGAGLIPSGPIGLELEATVRRVFAQMVVVLIYRQNPLLALLLRNAIRASGCGCVAPYAEIERPQELGPSCPVDGLVYFFNGGRHPQSLADVRSFRRLRERTDSSKI